MDQDRVYNHTTDLAKDKRVSDATFECVKAWFGAKGVVDLAGMTGMFGYCTFLAMPLNSAQHKIFKDQMGLKRLPQ